VRSFGHSLIIDPLGRIIAELPDNEGIITEDIDFNQVKAARSKLRMNIQ